MAIWDELYLKLAIPESGNHGYALKNSVLPHNLPNQKQTPQTGIQVSLQLKKNFPGFFPHFFFFFFAIQKKISYAKNKTKWTNKTRYSCHCVKPGSLAQIPHYFHLSNFQPPFRFCPSGHLLVVIPHLLLHMPSLHHLDSIAPHSSGDSLGLCLIKSNASFKQAWQWYIYNRLHGHVS